MIRAPSRECTSQKSRIHFLGPIKFVIFLTMMGAFILHHTVASALIWNEEKRLRYFLKSISLTCKFVMKFLGIKVQYVGERGEVEQKLIVANHLSYLDVLVLFAEYPSLFVTSQEIKETPVLGQICELAGCFFVERRKSKRNESTTANELAHMKDMLQKGHNIFLFPEGTSSDGKTVLPFKAAFFQLAVDTNSSVLPMTLKYQGQNSELMPWFGEMTFVPHLFNVCMQSEIKVHVNVLPEVKALEKFEFAQLTHNLIKTTYEKN